MDTFEIPLGIAEVEIETMETTQGGDFVITVRSSIEETNCHKCGKIITKFHGHDQMITLRHLSILGKETYLRIIPKRYQCSDCNGSTTTQILSWYNSKSRQTKAYEEYVLLNLINSTVSDVSLKENLGYFTITGIIDRYIGAEVNWDEIQRLDVIGLDEISLKKGHQDFVTIVTGRMGIKTMILAVLENRLKTTVKTFLSSIPRRLHKTLKAVCSDMYDGFINAAKEVFPKKVMIVVDRFHLAKSYRNELEKLRKKEMKRLKKELSEEKYKALKGVMWGLRKKQENLTQEEDQSLQKVFQYSPTLKLAYELCWELTDIFEEPISKTQAKRKIKQWKKKIEKNKLDCFDHFLSTLDNYFEEITNYFHDRYNSGFVEGLNNKIKVIKRRCYGILDTHHLFQRIYLDLEGYSIFT